MIMQSDPHLSQIVRAVQMPCTFAGTLNRWQQQCNQYPNDSDRYEQFDERETL
jgi:hypothetical protein